MFPVFEEHRFARHCRAGVEHQAVTLQPEYRRQRQPRGGEDRPRPHRNDNRIALDDGAINLDTCCAASVLPDAGHPPMAQFGTLHFGGMHHGRGESAGMDLGRGLGRAQGLGDGLPHRTTTPPHQPAVPSKPGEPSIGIEPAIAPIPCKLLRQLGMQCKAAPRQRCERRALAPIAREKPTGFSGGGASNVGAFEYNGLHAAAAQEIGDRGADHPAPANQHIHGFKRSLATSRPQFRRVMRSAPASFNVLMTFCPLVSRSPTYRVTVVRSKRVGCIAHL